MMGKFGSNDKGSTRIIRSDPTRLVRKTKDKEPDKVKATIKVNIDSTGVGNSSPSPAEAATKKLDPAVQKKIETTGRGDQPEFMKMGDKTKVFKPAVSKESEDTKASNETPVVGWLVIIEGPGKGRSLEFSFGQQSLGRDPDQSISLDFGDEEISRTAHATLEYDPRERKVFLSKGANLVYLNNERVGQGAEIGLKWGDIIELGSTKLRYVSFCSPDFCWTDSDS